MGPDPEQWPALNIIIRSLIRHYLIICGACASTQIPLSGVDAGSEKWLCVITSTHTA